MTGGAPALDPALARPRGVGHLPILDGLRGVAVLLVLWQHVPPSVEGHPEWLGYARLIGPGGLGVSIFFVLSGFLITRILLDERARGRPVRHFLFRRLLRIFPIYYLLLLVLWAVTGGFAALPWCALYLANFWFVFGAEDGSGALVQHTWSLSIEEHFYLLWPLAVALLPRGGALRLILFGVIPVALLAAPLAGLWLAPEPWADWVNHASPVQFLHLALGCLMAFGEQRIGARPSRFRWIGLAGCAAGLLFSQVVYVLVPLLAFSAPPWVPVPAWPLMNLAYTALLAGGFVLLAVASSRGRSPLQVLAVAPLRATGRISYGLYLYHVPVFHWLLLPPAGGDGAPAASGVALALLATFAIATVSYLAIERPLLRYGARFR